VPVIEVDGLVKRYDGRAVVDGVTFSVEEGEVFGILGPNGAGKTTIVESIEGLRKPDGGRIRVLGFDPATQSAEIHQRLGAQLQESRLPDRIKVWEALDLYSSFYRSPANWPTLLDQLGIADKRNERLKNLSGGQKQRLSIALALVGNPEIAILDELTTGLDPQARRDTWDLIEGLKKRGITIVLVTHFMEEAERLADRLALIDAGKVVAIDTPAGLIARTSPEQIIRFRPSVPVEDSLLTDLPEVKSVHRNGTEIVVRGTGEVLTTVITQLVRHQVVAEQLRVEQVTLDDAFVALTGRRMQPDDEPSSQPTQPSDPS
jgi:ABC-2 type transport system ATP-binding protein